MVDKLCRRCLAIKPVDEFYRRGGVRKDYQHNCKNCSKNQACEWAKNNKSRHAETKRAWRATKPEIYRKTLQEWLAKNPHYYRDWARKNKDKTSAATRKWKLNNKKHVAATAAEWQRRNKPVVAELTARRRGAQLKATPAWADFDAIREFYVRAKNLTDATGVKWHVDHIVPLQGKTVSGLHVHHNLQVLPASENISKHNRRWPGMP